MVATPRHCTKIIAPRPFYLPCISPIRSLRECPPDGNSAKETIPEKGSVHLVCAAGYDVQRRLCRCNASTFCQG